MTFASFPATTTEGLPTDKGLSMKELIMELEAKAPIAVIEPDPFPPQVFCNEDIVFIDSVMDDVDDE